MVEYFRADKRSFSTGQVIGTAGEFIDRHPDAGKRTEQVLSQRRPENKPERSTCLMLFEDEECARNFCCKISGGRLYTVEIRADQILHIGDMSLVDELARRIRDKGRGIEELADAYWEGENRDPGCVEILVSEGLVVKELEFTREEKTSRFKKLAGIPETSSEAIEDFWSIGE